MLDLEGCRDLRDLHLRCCRFDAVPVLRSAGVNNVYLSGSHLPGLKADLLEATGGVDLSDVEATGAVRLFGAKLGGNLSCEGGTFRAEKDAEGNPGKALSISGAQISAGFFLRRGARIAGLLDLTDADICHLNDDTESWPGAGCMILERCRYGAFIGGPVDAESRLAWLDLQEPCRWGSDFWPQPYEQCAKVLREMGHGGEARKVLVKKERLQRKVARNSFAARLTGARLRQRVEQEGEKAVRPAIVACLERFVPNDPKRKLVLTELRKSPAVRAVLDKSDRHASLVPDESIDRVSAARAPVWNYWWRLNAARVWDGLIGTTIGYGRAPQRAAIWASGFLLLGWFVFAVAAGHGAIKPNKEVVLRNSEWVERRESGNNRGEYRSQLACFLEQPQAESFPKFNAFIYSADRLLPIVSLEMQEYWIPDESSSRGKWARAYLWVHIAVGWALSLLAVAGFSGLVKSD